MNTLKYQYKSNQGQSLLKEQRRLCGNLSYQMQVVALRHVCMWLGAGVYQHLPFLSEASNTWKFVIEAFLICSSNTFFFSRNLAEVEITIWHIILNQVLCVPRTSSLGNDVDCDLSETFLGLAVLPEQSEQPVLESRERGVWSKLLPQEEKCEVKS